MEAAVWRLSNYQYNLYRQYGSMTFLVRSRFNDDQLQCVYEELSEVNEFRNKYAAYRDTHLVDPALAEQNLERWRRVAARFVDMNPASWRYSRSPICILN